MSRRTSMMRWTMVSALISTSIFRNASSSAFVAVRRSSGRSQPPSTIGCAAARSLSALDGSSDARYRAIVATGSAAADGCVFFVRGAADAAGRSSAGLDGEDARTGLGFDVEAIGGLGFEVDATGRSGDRDRLRDDGAELDVGRATNDEYAGAETGASELMRDEVDAASDALVRASRSSLACSCVCTWS